MSLEPDHIKYTKFHFKFTANSQNYDNVLKAYN